MYKRQAKEGAQFIIVTHSPILLGIPDADIYCFDNGRIHQMCIRDSSLPIQSPGVSNERVVVVQPA